MNTGDLRRYSRTGPDWIEARIELHRRLALPLACIMLALVGIPLGVSSRKGRQIGGICDGDLPGLLLLLPGVHHA